jgi:hypothetical protein
LRYTIIRCQLAQKPEVGYVIKNLLSDKLQFVARHDKLKLIGHQSFSAPPTIDEQDI